MPLRLTDRVQNAIADAFQGSARLAHVVQIGGQGILDVLDLAAAALEDQLYFDLLFFPLLEVNHGCFRAQVVAAVLAGQRIDGIRAQLAALGGFGHRFPDGLLHLDLIHPHRSVDHKGGHAGVLADGPLILLRHIDIRGNDVQRLRGLRVGSFRAQCVLHRFAHVRWQVGGGLGDEFDEALYEKLHFGFVPLVVVAAHITLAAIAAALAFLAAVIGTNVLGAVNANLRRRFVANAAEESCDLGHGVVPAAARDYFARAGFGWERSETYWGRWSGLVELAATTLTSRSPTAGF